jgi:PAS domain S-box-containing protein
MGSIKCPAFLKIIGYTKQELLSVSMTSFIHPDDRLKNLEIERLSKKSISEFENRYLTKKVLL